MKRSWLHNIKKIFQYTFLYPLDSALIFFREKKHKLHILFDNFSFLNYQTQNICLFIHYNINKELDDNCIHYLQSLKKINTDIVFITTSGINSDALNTLRKYCCAAISRTNLGRDIISYKIGVDFISEKLPLYNKLIIANDSVYGPLFDLDKLIAFGDKENLDFWGASDSYQIKYHLQSYFFVFTKKLFSSEDFKNYWKNVKLINHKRHLIEKYEVGITQYFLKKGYRCGAYCSYENINTTLSHKNSTQYFWDDLIIHHQFPFLKKELVLRNPTKIKRINFQEVIDRYAQYKIQL